MKQRHTLRHVVPAVLLAAVAAAAPVIAEDVEKKWRLGWTVGGFGPQDSVESDSANTLTLVDENLLFDSFYIDPRNDSAVFGELDMQPSEKLTFSAQYAISKIFLIEASIGYGKHDIGDVELQVQFDEEPIPSFQPFNFRVFRFNVGEVERIPLQLTAIARFRPRASFNPYVGLGVGYTWHGFDVNNEFNQLSMRLDGSFGGMARVTEATFGNPVFLFPSTFEDLTGASVELDDAFEWVAVIGAEYSFKRKWALIIDLRSTFANEGVSVQFNGASDLGVAVPERVDFITSPLATTAYGGFYIRNGGLVDGGQLVPEPSAPVGTDCTVSALNCVFDPTMPDGVPDPGIYYIQGGDFEYGGIGLNIGVRYTF